MRKSIYTLILPLLSLSATAQDLIFINSGNISSGYEISKFDSLAFDNGLTKGLFYG